MPRRRLHANLIQKVRRRWTAHTLPMPTPAIARQTRDTIYAVRSNAPRQ